jgi:deoxyribonuclease-4
MNILGAHMSIAGGYFKAAVAAHETGCLCVQLFTKNNNQWRAKPISDDDVARFQTALAEHNITHPISHDSYLINLASPDKELWTRSIDAFVVELQRAERLGIPYVVAHPGAFTTSSESKGIKRIARALDEVHKQTRALAARCLLETTAGQGSNLGWRFEHLAEIIAAAKDPERLGVCFDTCHVFSAGYAMQSEKEYKATMRELDKTVGLKLVRAFHLNDSKTPFGSRVDRHAHIGQGSLGLEPFRHLLNDRRFKKIPMYLETPKGQATNRETFDQINLRTLRGLVEDGASPATKGKGTAETPRRAGKAAKR